MTDHCALARVFPSEHPLVRIERALAVVEVCLCETFPVDFHRRCAFAAHGLRALLRDDDLDAQLVGGKFAAFVMTPDGKRLAVQGFEKARDPAPHFWVEAYGRLIDLGPYLLAFGSDYEVVSMPAVAWDLSLPLPAALRYKASHRLSAESRMSSDPEVCAQSDSFIDRCRTLASTAPAPPLPTWLATDPAALIAAIGRGDAWATGAQKFEQHSQHQALPF